MSDKLPMSGSNRMGSGGASEYGVKWEYTLDVIKLSSTDGRRVIAGYASNEDVDTDLEIMDMTALKSAFPGYVKNGIVRFMHDTTDLWKGAIGKVIPEYTDAEGVVHKTSFEDKPYLVIEVSKSPLLDPVWELISDPLGLYRGLSIGGKILKRTKEFSEKVSRVVDRLHLSDWIETSVVDTPSAKGSFFSVLKSAGMSLPEENEVEKEEVEKSGDVNMAEGNEDFGSLHSAIEALTERMTKLEGAMAKQFSNAGGQSGGTVKGAGCEEDDKKAEKGAETDDQKDEEDGMGGDNKAQKKVTKSPDVEAMVTKALNEKMTPIVQALERIEKMPGFKGHKEVNPEDVKKSAEPNNVIESMVGLSYRGA